MQPSFSNIIGAANTTGPVLGATEKSERIPSAILTVSNFVRELTMFGSCAIFLHYEVHKLMDKFK